MLFIKLFFVAASLLAQAHFFASDAADPGHGSVNVTVADSTLAAIRARIAASELSPSNASSSGAPSSDASPADSDRSRIEAPVAAR